MELADRKLVVQRASSRRNASSDDDSRGVLSIMASSTAFSAPGTRAEPSPVLLLLNILEPGDFEYSNTLEEIRKEIEQECMFFGPVDTVKLLPPVPGSITDTGRVFILQPR